MTTKEFIKMLQDADPSGESHIRMSGGIPYAAIEKEGYWDGPYTYIDKDGNYVYTTKGTKVDIYCTDIWDFVDEKINRGATKWEDVESKFKFELGYANSSQRNERELKVLDEAKKAFNEINEIEIKHYNMALSEMKTKAEKGWTWFQDKKVEGNKHYTYYGWKVIDENGKVDSSNVWMTESVQKSGLWEKVDNGIIEGFYQWIYKN